MGVPKWNEERTNKLLDLAGNVSEVAADVVLEAAKVLETSTRSITSKLRKLGFEVESMAKTHTKSFTDEQEAALTDFLDNNTGEFTYAEIAESVFNGDKTAKEVQGKILSMERVGDVKPTPKVEVAKKYTEEEEAIFEKMVRNGAFLEDIAEKLNKPLNSVRGKALSFNRSKGLDIPKQRQSYAQPKADPIEALGDISELTVADIATRIEKSERGVKGMLTHRKLTCKDYDGAKKAQKIEDSKAA